MKKLFLLLMLIGGSLQAQITLTNATFPSIGDTLKTSFNFAPQGITVTAPGPNQIWDYSSLSPTATNNLIFEDPANGANFASFPDANLMIQGLGNETYLKKDVGKIDILGFAGPDPIGTGGQSILAFSPPRRQANAPITYGDVINTNSSATIGLSPSIFGPLLDSLPVEVDSIRIILNVSKTTEVDAWGSMEIPAGTFEVLRLKNTEIQENGIEVLVEFIPGFPVWIDPTIIPGFPQLPFLEPDTSIGYEFLNDIELEPIAVLTLDSLQNIIGIEFKVGEITVGTQDLLSADDFNVFPNPAQDYIHLTIKGVKDGDYTLVMTDLSGRLIQTKEISIFNTKTDYEWEVSNTPEGIYFCQLLDSKGQLFGRKQIMIVK